MINMMKLMEEYEPNDDIFCEDSEDMRKLKHIIFDRLPEVDKRVILLYSELQSLRKVAKYLGVSPSTAYILINRIKTDIKNLC